MVVMMVGMGPTWVSGAFILGKVASVVVLNSGGERSVIRNEGSDADLGGPALQCGAVCERASADLDDDRPQLRRGPRLALGLLDAAEDGLGPAVDCSQGSTACRLDQDPMVVGELQAGLRASRASRAP